MLKKQIYYHNMLIIGNTNCSYSMEIVDNGNEKALKITNTGVVDFMYHVSRVNFL